MKKNNQHILYNYSCNIINSHSRYKCSFLYISWKWYKYNLSKWSDYPYEMSSIDDKEKYDYTSLSVFAAYNKYKKNIKNTEKSVLIVTAKNRGINYDK